MSLFSFLRKNKNKQESASADGAFHSRAEEESKAVRSRSRRRGNQGAAPTDPVLPEKKRARRRLIGAIALVLAAVIGLPMLLDSEPKPLASDIAIQIPSKDKPADSARATAASTPPAASLDPKEEVLDEPGAPEAKAPTATPQEPEAAEAPPAPSKAKEAAKTDTVAVAAAPKAAGNKAAAAQPPANTKKDAKLADSPADSARARALLEGKPDPKAAESKSGKFVIQVAALASKEKVDELQGKLKQAGIKSYTQKVGTQSGERTRIRVGPFASKEEAEKVRAKMGKLGLGGSVVPA